MISETNAAYLANQYFWNCVHMKKDAFESSLAEDVKLIHVRMTGGFEGEPICETGKNAVIEGYNKYFFDVTSDIKVNKYKITSAGNTAKLVCNNDENKLDSDGITRYFKIIDETTLTFKKCEDGIYRIAEILSRVSKTLLTADGKES